MASSPVSSDLLKDPWIPVTDSSNIRKIISLRELLCSGERFAVAHVRDDLELAAIQMCASLVQVVFAPNCGNEIPELCRIPMSDADFDQKTASFAGRFMLRNDKAPEDKRVLFMQDARLKERLFRAAKEKRQPEPVSMQKLFPGLPGGESSYFFNSDRAIEKICPSCAAIALFNNASCAPGAGRGYCYPLRFGGPVSVLVYDRDLRVMVWKNVLPKDFKWYRDTERRVESDNGFLFTWEALPSGNISPADISIARGLFWQSSLRLMEWSDTCGICDCCGMEAPFLAVRMYMGGLDYSLSSSWVHPHSAYWERKEKNGRITLLPVSGEKCGYRWIALWDLLPAGLSDGSPLSFDLAPKTVLNHREIFPAESPSLVIGGYKNDKAAIKERRHEILPLSAHWQHNIPGIRRIIEAATGAENILSETAKFLDKQPKTGKNGEDSEKNPFGRAGLSAVRKRMRDAFIRESEGEIRSMIVRHASLEAPELQKAVQDEFLPKLKTLVLGIFNSSMEPWKSDYRCLVRILNAERFCLRSSFWKTGILKDKEQRHTAIGGNSL